jgi:hypothetical protein
LRKNQEILLKRLQKVEDKLNDSNICRYFEWDDILSVASIIENELIHIDKELAKDTLLFMVEYCQEYGTSEFIDVGVLLGHKKHLNDKLASKVSFELAFQRMKESNYTRSDEWLNLIASIIDADIINDVAWGKKIMKTVLNLDTDWYVDSYIDLAKFVFEVFNDEKWSREIINSELEKQKIKLTNLIISGDILYPYGDIVDAIIDIYEDEKWAKEALFSLIENNKVEATLNKFINLIQEDEYINWASMNTQYILNIVYDINYLDENGNSLFMYAIEYKHYSCIDFIMVRDPDINIVNKNGSTALSIAITQNNRAVIEYILSRTPKKKDGLIIAIENQNIELIKFLLKNNFDLNEKFYTFIDYYSATLLSSERASAYKVFNSLDLALDLYSQGNSEYVEIIKTLIVYGAELSSATNHTVKNSQCITYEKVIFFQGKDSLDILMNDSKFNDISDMVNKQYSFIEDEPMCAIEWIDYSQQPPKKISTKVNVEDEAHVFGGDNQNKCSPRVVQEQSAQMTKNKVEYLNSILDIEDKQSSHYEEDKNFEKKILNFAILISIIVTIIGIWLLIYSSRKPSLDGPSDEIGILLLIFGGAYTIMGIKNRF